MIGYDSLIHSHFPEAGEGPEGPGLVLFGRLPPPDAFLREGTFTFEEIQCPGEPLWAFYSAPTTPQKESSPWPGRGVGAAYLPAPQHFNINI